MTQKRESPQFIVRDGKPTAVILDIDEYEELLERLEEAEDLVALRSVRQTPLKFRTLDGFLKEYHARV